MPPPFDKPSSIGSFRHDLARWRQLVAAPWLARLLAGEAVEAAPQGSWRLIEVGCGGQHEFERGHIPGATWLDTGALELPPLFARVGDPALRALLLAHGVRHDTTVILYGRSTLAAARAAHLMLYAGVADVRLLDGGHAAWQAAGLPVQTGPAPLTPAADFGAAFPACPHFLLDLAGARRALRDPGARLASIRTWSEHTGLTSGYSYIDARGDIPGALWGHAGREGDVQSMSDYQLADATMRPAAQIDAMWRAAGIHPARHTAFYCGTGWRASLAFFYAWLMGWDDISVYDGGWLEWSQDSANPVRRAVDEAELSASGLR